MIDLYIDEEEYVHLIEPNSMTIKNMVKEIIPESNVKVKIGSVGPGVYIYCDDKNASMDKLYTYFKTFYFGQVISKYIRKVPRESRK